MTNAIEIRSLTHRFGAVTAVNGLSLTVARGEFLALLGVNGAGKTTAIRLMSGLLPVQEGEIRIMGHPAGSASAKAALGLSPQETAVAGNLTALENLEMIARIHGLSPVEARRAADVQIAALSLEEIANRRAKKLSGGWQRRLSIAMALISRPDVLILDEPTLGLDVLARRELWEVIRSLHGRATLLLTTHYLEEAEALSDRIAVMAKGRLCALDTAENLKAQTGADTFEDAFIALAGKGGIAQ